jgi:hypothetical protein
MDTALMIIGFHAVFLGSACFIAGFGSLVAPGESEVAADRRAYEIERAKSWWSGFVFALAQASSARSRGLSLAARHWPERPEGRKFMYAAAAFIAIAVVIGYHFGIFSS